MTNKARSTKDASVGSGKIEQSTIENIPEYLRTFSERLSVYSSWNWPRIFFVICFIFFFLIKFSLSVLPLANRVEPVEPDDAYRYMAQAVIMKECFSGDCLAISSLEQQMQGAVDVNEVAFQRLRTDMYLFNYFHPAYSLAFNFFHGAGLHLVEAHNLIFVISAILMLALVAAWMLTLWGYIPAGIALLLISSQVLGEAGLHSFVPSNMSLGLGIASWILILRKSKNIIWLAPILWIAAIGMHSMGLLHVATGILILLLTSSWPLPLQTKRLVAIGLALFALRIGVSFVIPEFGLAGNIAAYYAQTPSLGTILSSAIESLILFPKQWANTYWSFYALAFFLIVGFLTIPKKRSSNVIAMAIALLIAFIASSAYYHPQHGNTATARMWTPLFFFLSGAVGNFVYRSLLAIADFVKSLIHNSSSDWTRKGSLLSARGWLGAGLLLIGLVMAQSFSNYIGIGIKHQRLTLEDSLNSSNLHLDNAVITDLKNRLGVNDAVLFTQEIPLEHALANALLDNEIVYRPLLSGQEQTQELITNNQSLLYFVLLNPLRTAIDLPTGAISIDQVQDLSFSSDVLLDPASISVRLENPGDEITLTILYGEDENQVAEQFQVRAGSNGWIALPASAELVSKISVSSLETGELLLRGISLADDQETNWPWDQGIEFTYDEVTASFSSKNLLEEFGLGTEIIADGGSLLVAKIIR